MHHFNLFFVNSRVGEFPSRLTSSPTAQPWAKTMEHIMCVKIILYQNVSSVVYYRRFFEMLNYGQFIASVYPKQKRFAFIFQSDYGSLQFFVIQRKNLYHCNSQSQCSHCHDFIIIQAYRYPCNEDSGFDRPGSDSSTSQCNDCLLIHRKNQPSQYCLITLHKSQNSFGSRTTSLKNCMVTQIFFRRRRLVWRNGVHLSTGKSSFTPLCHYHCADFDEIHPSSDTLWRKLHGISWKSYKQLRCWYKATDGRMLSSNRASRFCFVKKNFQPLFFHCQNRLLIG